MDVRYFTESFVRSFWLKDDHADENYIEPYPNETTVNSIEEELGWKLPASYVELMRVQNGGYPVNTHFVLLNSPDSEPEYFCMDGFFGIGRDKPYTLCGEMGRELVFNEWGYPNDGVYIGRFVGGYHNLLLLDYSNCSKEEEPSVVMVDQENDYKKTFLAKDFESFVKILVNESVFDRSEEELESALIAIRNAPFSKVLQSYFMSNTKMDFEPILRKLLEQLCLEKGSFHLHDDVLSYKVYDILFFLVSEQKNGITRTDYLNLFPDLLVLSDGEINTGGYAPGFIEDWWEMKEKSGKIIVGDENKYAMNSDDVSSFLNGLITNLNHR